MSPTGSSAAIAAGRHEPALERGIRIEIAVARRGADPLGAIDDAERRLDGIADEELEDAS